MEMSMSSGEKNARRPVLYERLAYESCRKMGVDPEIHAQRYSLRKYARDLGWEIVEEIREPGSLTKLRRR